MGTADFNLNMTLKGKPEELQTLVNAFKGYSEGKNEAYFSFVQTEQCDDGSLKISALGPWGHYGVLNDVDVFRDLATAAPGASFKAKISGSTSYTQQELEASLENGILHICTYYEGNEEADEAYGDYFQKALPYRKFVKLFHLDKEEFDKDCYEEFIASDIFEEDISEWDYDEFTDIFADYFAEDVDEDTFDEIMESFNALSIKSFDDFRFAHEDEFGTREEIDYDPISKTYIGRPAPLKTGQAYIAEDLAERGIDLQGLISEMFGDEDDFDDEEEDDE